MTDAVLRHIGERIKHYRKARRMTIDELSREIHKSKGSISKYENGQIAIDIATLFDLAAALHIKPESLIDYPVNLPKTNIHRNPFGNADTIYMYHRKSNTAYESVIKIHQDSEASIIAATVYYIVKSNKYPYESECIYKGAMHCHDTVLCFTLQNDLNSIENLLINLRIPMKRFETLTGILFGLGANTLIPECYVCTLSTVPLQINEELKAALKIPKESIEAIKKRNVFAYYMEHNS